MKICYTGRSIWFNGICGFQLDFNSKRSDSTNFQNLCFVTIYPLYVVEVP